MQSREINLKTHAFRGFSLIEMAVGIMLMGIIGVAVSSLVSAGVQTQMNQRMMNVSQTVGMNVVDDLRYDLRTADGVTLVNANTLQLTAQNGDTIQYQYAANTITRQDTTLGATKNYVSGISPTLQIVCTAPCFSWKGTTSGLNPNASIILGDLSVQPANDPFATNSPLAAFGVPVWYKLSQASFNIMVNQSYK